jgi:hypothetical protein
MVGKELYYGSQNGLAPQTLHVHLCPAKYQPTLLSSLCSETRCYRIVTT